MKLTTAQIAGISVAAGLLVALALWYFFVRKPRNDARRNWQKLDEDKAGKLNLWLGCNDNFPIRLFSCGERVKKLQEYFNKKGQQRGWSHGLEQIPVDGRFGPRTLNQAYRHMSIGGQTVGSLSNKDYLAIKGIREADYKLYEPYFP